MSIPNVTMRWCQKSAECKYDGCREQIEPGEAMVAVFFWNKGGDNRRWNVQRCYHPECWVKQGMEYLRMNPYVPKRSTGRKKLELDETDRRTRFLITRRYHALKQRLGKLDNGSEPLKSLRIESQIMELILEIQPVGGVPKKWLESI